MKRLHTPEEVAESLGVSRKTVYRLVSEGKIRSVKVGRQIRISDDAVGQYLGEPRVAMCDRTGCEEPVAWSLGIPHGESPVTFVCELHWQLDYKDRLGETIQVVELSEPSPVEGDDHQPDTKEVSV